MLHRALPDGRIVELARDLPPHQVGEAGFLLAQMAHGFPPGTVHVAIVDPGVGGPRRPIVVRCPDGSLLVGPDNGLLAPLAERLGGGVAREISRRDRAAAPAGIHPTFEGRDLFAPVAAELARGRPVTTVGPRVPLTPSPLAAPRRTERGAAGTVAHIDRFGNVITNVPTEWIAGPPARISVGFGGIDARSLPRVRVYAELATAGDLAVLGSSFGTVEIGARERSAAEALRVEVGRSVRLARAAGGATVRKRVNSARRTNGGSGRRRRN